MANDFKPVSVSEDSITVIFITIVLISLRIFLRSLKITDSIEDCLELGLKIGWELATFTVLLLLGIELGKQIFTQAFAELWQFLQVSLLEKFL
jgi:hypothetical protein